MKKMLSVLLAMVLMLGTVPAVAIENNETNTIPKEIMALFDVPAWEGFQVMTNEYGWSSWVYQEQMDAGVVVMSNGSLNIVCIVEPDKNGNLRITQRNYKMVVGDEAPIVDWCYGTTPYELATPWGEHPMFEIQGNGYYIAFGKFDGVWRVKTVIDYATETLSYVFNEKIGYVDAEDGEDYLAYNTSKMKYAYGTYDNRFAAFNIYDFPKSLAEAREKLTNPPVTPTDFYTPVNVNLRANEKYDVFAAPGRSSYRAANGKAELSTNDWVQIFGEEDGWLLVQYDISRDQMRFGYIAASALPRNTEVQQLRWYDLPEQTIKTNTYVTDDPLASRDIICWLDAGDKVKVLSDFGSWYYVEVTPGTGKTLRGFIPQTAIELITWDDMKG
jgi:hypothetical protein